MNQSYKKDFIIKILDKYNDIADDILELLARNFFHGECQIFNEDLLDLKKLVVEIKESNIKINGKICNALKYYCFDFGYFLEYAAKISSGISQSLLQALYIKQFDVKPIQDKMYIIIHELDKISKLYEQEIKSYINN